MLWLLYYNPHHYFALEEVFEWGTRWCPYHLKWWLFSLGPAVFPLQAESLSLLFLLSTYLISVSLKQVFLLGKPKDFSTPGSFVTYSQYIFIKSLFFWYHIYLMLQHLSHQILELRPLLILSSPFLGWDCSIYAILISLFLSQRVVPFMPSHLTPPVTQPKPLHFWL